MDGSPSSFILIFILISINAFFASSEMAIVSLNKTKINLLAEEGNIKAILLQRLLLEPSGFLATIQVGITFAGFFASASAATSISSTLAQFLKQFNVPYSNDIAILAITILISYLTLVLGELLPKRIALQNSEKVAMFVVKPILFISKLTKPFVWLLSCSTNILLKLLGMKTVGVEEKVSREELKSLVEIGEQHGAINESEREMIDGIIKFDDTLAKEIMTPRTETFLLEVNSSIKENINKILEENYSRIPIYENNIDNIVGILYMKDLFSNIIFKGIDNVYISEIIRKPCFICFWYKAWFSEIIRKPCFIPETNNIDDVFKHLKSTKNHMALLIDEYGGFSGIVTLEDLVEEVMGEISDEYDEDKPDIEKIDENKYTVNGLMSIDKLNEVLDLELQSESADTVGGLFLEHLGRVPKKTDGIEVKIGKVLLKLVNLDEKRIEKLMITIE